MSGRLAPADIRSPLGRARGLGSARSGTGHFWWLRVTSVVVALLTFWLLWLLISLVGADLAEVRATLARPWHAILLAVFCSAMFWHAKLGIQTVIEDYVHTRWMEVLLQFLNLLACAIAGLAAIYAIARIAVQA